MLRITLQIFFGQIFKSSFRTFNKKVSKIFQTKNAHLKKISPLVFISFKNENDFASIKSTVEIQLTESQEKEEIHKSFFFFL